MNLTNLDQKQAEQILYERFKINKFYDLQWETISHLLKGERVLLIEKTGYGKSLCFQFPAVLFEGLTVVFSPLIALMRDQERKLQSLGIAARCLNSGQSSAQNTSIIKEARSGKLKILYIAPERQENIEWLDFIPDLKLSMIVVDEAHCISVWGHDFRPAFRRIIDLVNLLPKGLPVLAITATATKQVEMDIATQITGDINVLRGNLIRDNFKLYVIDVTSEDEKMMWLGHNIPKLEGSGIIYTGRIVDTEVYSKWLEFLKIPCRSYNSRLDSDTKKEVEEGLRENTWKCVISTNALGMGIDKPDIRFIVHTQFPQSPVHYYQEIGRAGRDGKPTVIILLYNPEDRDLPEAFIEGGKPPTEKYIAVKDALRLEMLGEKDIMKHTNLRQTQTRVIIADLIDQGIIRRIIIDNKKKYEFVRNSQPLDTQLFFAQREAKTQDMEKMIRYAETKESRMGFLCSFLGDNVRHDYKNCDNTGLVKHKVHITDEWIQKLVEFRENYFPILEVETHGSNIKNGLAASYYGISNVASAIHKSKYERGGDFPEFLIKLMLKAFRSRFSKVKFDVILYMPPTISGNLVSRLAQKVSWATKIPISHSLYKVRYTKPQKGFENTHLKTENVKDAFEVLHIEQVKGKNILLIDDIFDSGASMKEVGRYLTKCGASMIVPLVLARTVGGDRL